MTEPILDFRFSTPDISNSFSNPKRQKTLLSHSKTAKLNGEDKIPSLS
ncbi:MULTISPECIES: hypothetical protein [unclassified Nostoc]|nr:hypothetical protein [Nostoc sp. 'Peltigera membranacea cyanobiont' 232]